MGATAAGASTGQAGAPRRDGPSPASDEAPPSGDAAAGCRLQATRLTKTYGNLTAVGGVDLDIPPGKLLTLLGPSGCGKTTILQAIAGFVVPDAGDIAIDGRSILPIAPERRETAMLFQHYALFPHMTVAENVGFGLRMRRLARGRIAAEVAAVLRLVRVEDLAGRYPDQLSGGQRQRVALARAIVTHPKVLLLDEPFAALDQNLREAMQVELRKLQQRLGITALIVTHDQKEAIVLSDLIAVMNAGRIEQIGPPIEIYDRPHTRFVAAFTGVENIVPVRVLERSAGRVDIAVADAVVLRVAEPPRHRDGELHLAVRSEAIEIAAASQRGAGAVRGTVGFTRIFGPIVRYEVAIDDRLTITVSSPRRDGDALAPGTAVDLTFAPARCALVAGS